jgi:hypothetical protein
MKIPIALQPDDIIKHYQIQEKVLDGYVHMEIRKGMYGLPRGWHPGQKTPQGTIGTS